MLKRLRVIGYVFVLLVGLFFVAPVIVDRIAHRLTKSAHSTPSAAAAQLHRALWVADLHSDALLWNRDLTQRQRRGHVDLVRLREGNIAIQAFTIVTKTPFGLNIERNPSDSDMLTLLMISQLWPPRTWFSLKERALFQAAKLRKAAERSGGKFHLLRTRADLEAFLRDRQHDPSLVAGFLGIEGAHALEGNLANIDVFFKAGVRMMAPTHFFDNDIGGSAHGLHKGALTPKGREMIGRMEEKGMLLDLAHASPAVIVDALAIARRPVVVSHTGVKGTCDNNRNLSDDQLRQIAANGGVVGIGFWSLATCGEDVSSIVRAIRHAATIMGVNHVALGSDFDGMVRPPFDSSGMVAVTDALLQARFSEADIAKIMGENVLRLLAATLPPN